MKKRSNRSWRVNRANFEYFKWLSTRNAEVKKEKRAREEVFDKLMGEGENR